MVVKCFWKIHRKIPVLECLLNKVVGLQDCCKTYLVHAHLRFYFSLGKTSKNFINVLYRPCSSKNVKCKVMFIEAYLEPSRTFAMELFYKNG